MVREIQPFKDARAELRGSVYTCDMCDLWSNIKPSDMLSLFSKHLQVTFLNHCFLSLVTIFG